MKFLLMITLFCISCSALSQKKSFTYMSLMPFFGVSFKSGAMYGGTIQAGVKTSEDIGIGAGVDFTRFIDSKGLYTPLYADVRFCNPKSKFYVAVQPGIGFRNYTIYKSDTYSNIEKGGFFLAGGIGMQPYKTGPAFSIRYCSYGLSYMDNSGNMIAPNQRVNAIVVNIGISLN